MANKTYIELGALVREYRTKAGMTQLELSQKLGYESTQFVSLFERGLSKVPINVLGQLVTILHLPEMKIMKMLMDSHREHIQEELSSGKDKAATTA